VLGYAALSSATLRDVNVLIKRSKPLVEEFTLYSDAIVKGEWHMEFTTAYPMSDVLPFVMEELFSRSNAESMAYTGVDVPFKQLHLTYPEPAYAKLYRKHFGCPVRFSQKRNVGVVEGKYLALPIVFSDPAACRLCENQCTRLLGPLQDSTSIGAAIRRRIILHPGNCPSLHEMSVAVGVSATTLKRKLRDEGETYQHIVDAIRREVSIMFLRETQLTAEEVSYRLGYSNVHNFRRAFKAWTGVNPTYFQR
jgi:AraC-like DNA-binding protein